MDKEFTRDFQFILDAIAKGVFGVDREGTITFCNEALLQLTGYTLADIVGENAHEALHAGSQDGIKHSREQCPLQTAILQGAPADAGGLLRRKDGSSVPVEYTGRPLQQPVGRTVYVGTVKDVSDIEMTKEALRRSEEQYRRILESMPDVAWTSDLHGRTRYVSPKVNALLGFTNQEIYAGGTHLWLNQIHPADLGGSPTATWRCLSSK